MKPDRTERALALEHMKLGLALSKQVNRLAEPRIDWVGSVQEPQGGHSVMHEYVVPARLLQGTDLERVNQFLSTFALLRLNLLVGLQEWITEALRICKSEARTNYKYLQCMVAMLYALTDP